MGASPQTLRQSSAEERYDDAFITFMGCFQDYLDDHKEKGEGACALMVIKDEELISV